MSYKTEQEAFWAGEFGNAYSGRNVGDDWIASNTAFFARVLAGTRGIDSVIEFGSNIGLNLHALNRLLPAAALSAIEINSDAVRELESWGKLANIYNTSILDFDAGDLRWDLTLVKGVLIHINPDELPGVYAKLYEYSERYILIAEYYNPSPVTINYRGHENRLFKRDFAGEFLDTYTDVELVDYGFSWHRDPNFPQDDLTWFLLRKT